ncbi:MAG: hypothetical protein J6M43_00245 [Neisseriaceae bacterium]|nr:hypothetical protein [Neisseriaceae bacterium]
MPTLLCCLKIMIFNAFSTSCPPYTKTCGFAVGRRATLRLIQATHTTQGVLQFA